MAPMMALQPTSQAVVAGNVATVTALADGNPAPTVQWEVNQNDGQGWINVVPVPGIGTTLSAPVAPYMNGWKFRAVFTNSQGSVTSDEVTLTVL